MKSIVTDYVILKEKDVVTQIKEGKRGAQEQVLNKWKKKNLSMDT
jgi:hypothetical protein